MLPWGYTGYLFITDRLEEFNILNFINFNTVYLVLQHLGMFCKPIQITLSRALNDTMILALYVVNFTYAGILM